MDEEWKQRFFTSFIEDTEHAFAALDAEARIQAWSSGIAELTGHAPEDMLGKPFSTLFADEGACARVLEEVKKSGLLRNYETLIVHHGGGQERVQLTVRAVEDAGHLVEVRPVVEDMGEAPDKRTIQETLVKMERFSAVGRMTAAFAHEMRTPIHIISSTAELILSEMSEDAPPRENVEMILRNAEHASLSVRALLDFATVGKAQLRKGSINEVFEMTIQLIGKLFEKQNIQVETALGELPDILMDAQNMRAVVHSLLVNAADAMPEGGKLGIKTEVAAENGHVRFSVSDTGVGMSSEVLERIGSAFFTTKENGTGLGLYLTKRVLAEHGAEITFASAEGHGSTITIDFPPGK